MSKVIDRILTIVAIATMMFGMVLIVEESKRCDDPMNKIILQALENRGINYTYVSLDIHTDDREGGLIKHYELDLRENKTSRRDSWINKSATDEAIAILNASIIKNK